MFGCTYCEVVLEILILLTSNAIFVNFNAIEVNYTIITSYSLQFWSGLSTLVLVIPSYKILVIKQEFPTDVTSILHLWSTFIPKLPFWHLLIVINTLKHRFVHYSVNLTGLKEISLDFNCLLVFHFILFSNPYKQTMG